jgi:N-acetylglucosaminyl-diphospho-decaprenol L-rhamnosyltransferase
LPVIFFINFDMNSRDYDISVVIVTYNNRDIIPRCLATLSRVMAAYASQVCIIDNNSSDGTADYLRNALWNDFHFTVVEKVFNEANLGYTKGANQGLQRCLGRTILLLNPDIIFSSNPFERLLDELQQDECLGVVSPQLRFFNGDIQPSCRRFPKKADVFYEFLGLSRLFSKSEIFNAWRMPDFNHRISCDVPQPQGAFLLMRHDVLRTVGLLDESLPMFFSDVDWCYRVRAHGWRIRFIADAFVYHMRGASVRQKKARMIISSHQSFITFFQKYDRTWRDKCTTKIVFFLLLIATPVRLLFHLNRL